MKKKIAHSLDHGTLSLFIQALIVVFVVTFTLETMPSMQKYSATFDLLNIAFTVIFVFELLTRLLVYEKPLRYLSSFLVSWTWFLFSPLWSVLTRKGFE